MAKINLFSAPTGEIILVNVEGVVVSPGAIVHVTAGPSMGRAYRYEGVVTVTTRAGGSHGHTHRVKCSRKATHGHFRAVEWMAPAALGCTVHAPLSMSERIKARWCHMWSKVDDYLWAGAFALIPLALFEHFHMAARITEVVSLGMLGTTGVDAGH
jgi:hypothetical protein